MYTKPIRNHFPKFKWIVSDGQTLAPSVALDLVWYRTDFQLFRKMTELVISREAKVFSLHEFILDLFH